MTWHVTGKCTKPGKMQHLVDGRARKNFDTKSVIRFDAQELKKVKRYVLHNSPEIDTYQSQFKRYLVDEDDDITDDEDALPHDLADSDNEDLINVDDDGVDKGGDGGGEDRPLHTMYPAVAWVALLTEFDLRPHMESPDWTEINAGIQQHLQKSYNTNKAAFKAQH
nr:hypothetical protein [Tanacetum cinerariifolium]